MLIQQKPQLIEDIGIKSRHRYGKYKCPSCGCLFERRISCVEKKNKYNCLKCLRRESSKHGDTGKRIYRVWTAMRDRCENNNNNSYHNYGGRGISICSEWSEYSSFKEWAVNNGYKENLTIDRINNNKGYSPDNCKFSTYHEQAVNQRISKLNKTGLRGVTKRDGKYIARLMVDGASVYYKTFKTGEEAARERDAFILNNGLTEYKLNYRYW